MAVTNSASGDGRSSYMPFNAPGVICSKPTASAHSTAPLATAWRARNKADDPLEQLLFTLNIGMPVSPAP